MRIKRFVQTNIILSILLIVTLYGLSWIYVNYVNDRTVKFMEYNKLSDNSVDLVVLGSSHGKFGIKVDKPNQMNLALEQQGIYYSLKLLEKYQDKIKDGAIVIIPLSIFSFYETDINADTSKDEIYKNYVNLLPKKEIRKVLTNSQYLLMNKFSVLYPPARLVTTLKWFMESIKSRNFKKNIIVYNENIRGKALEEEAKGTAKGHTKGLNQNLVKNGINYLEQMMTFIKLKNWNPIFIITPYSFLYNDELEKIEKNIYKNKIFNNVQKLEKSIQKKYILLDYSHDFRFENKIEYFMDDDHLNEKGAEYFTDILLKDIDERIKRNE